MLNKITLILIYSLLVHLCILITSKARKRDRHYSNLARKGDKDALGEINAAKAFKAEGTNVHFRQSAGDQGVQGVQTSDFFVGGKPGTGNGCQIFDVYSPSTGNSWRVVGGIAKKLGQTDRIVLNVDNTTLTIDDI